ncbi:MAG: hypothetical protein A2Z29_08530 [Chloroflexi bacterium RBG_16_56_11]|nr:MAG: hypothetical protein A2Z29_08530 [Chloroflexi bacterium RBG_16_56_11]
MKVNDLIAKSLEESRDYIGEAIKGLTGEELAWKPRPHSNSIAFLLWHVARVEDLWINRVLLAEKDIYETGCWYKKFGTPPGDTGFGYDVDKLTTWRVPGLDLLLAYAAAVREKTLSYLKSVTAGMLDTERDFGWRKGTTGTALSHLVTEVAEHSGQIGYIRGIIKGIAPPPPPPPPKT